DLRVLYTQDSSVFTFYLFDADAASTDMYTLSLHDALPISDGDPAGCFAEDALDGESLEFVVVGGAGAVGVDVVHLVGGDAGGAEGAGHGHAEAFAFGVGHGDVVGVGGGGVAGDLAVDARAAFLGVFKGFEHEHAGAFAHDEAVAAEREGTAGGGGG